MLETINGKSSTPFFQTASGISLPVPTGLLPTGQTTKYVDGDDGDYEKGYKPPGDHFIDNGDGTITDNATGLMWQQANDDTQRGWEAAVSYAEGLELAGHDDWRMPNIKELSSLVDFGKADPAIDEVYFTNIYSSSYWSSTTVLSDITRAWIVNFISGYASAALKGGSYYTLCVRG